MIGIVVPVLIVAATALPFFGECEQLPSADRVEAEFGPRTAGDCRPQVPATRATVMLVTAGFP